MINNNLFSSSTSCKFNFFSGICNDLNGFEFDLQGSKTLGMKRVRNDCE